MTQKVSTTYSKEHCICYDELDNDRLVAVKIEPNDGYRLRYTDGDGSNDVSGFALININVIDTFDSYTAVENSTETPTDADEISDSEELAIITTGGNDND